MVAQVAWLLVGRGLDSGVGRGLIAAEPAMEICFGISVVGLVGSGAGTGAAPVAWSLEKFPSLLAFNVYFFLLLQI